MAAASEPSSVGRELVDGIDRQPIHRGSHAEVHATATSVATYTALKLATDATGDAAVEAEAAVLAGLSSEGLPRLLGAGRLGGRAYVCTPWIWGVDARIAATGMRTEGDLVALLRLCGSAASVLGRLHAAGLVHGQLHPRHLRVEGSGAAKILDFSAAARPSTPARTPQALTTLSAPEQAGQWLRGEPLTGSFAAEQYSLAALLYLLVTGRMYAPLRRVRDGLAADIAGAAPLAFDAHGVAPWPALEAVLHHALAPVPDERYPSLDELAVALAEVDPRSPGRTPAATRPTEPPLLASFRRLTGLAGEAAALPPPRCSVNYGAAGIAYAYVRLYDVGGDAAALGEAERWLRSAQAYPGRDGFLHGEELSAAVLGTISPFHSRSGLAAVAALICGRRDDAGGMQEALHAYVAATQGESAELDLTVGACSVVLVGAILLATADPRWPASRCLAAHGDALCARVRAGLSTREPEYNGIAHGWAGIAYALMMWAAVRGAGLPPEVEPILVRLARQARPDGRGCRWPIWPDTSDAQSWPGWCHGHAGYVFLWNLAASFTADPRHRELAERAAWMTVDAPAPHASLCCGAAGQAYALLNQFRHSGDRLWLTRAEALTVAATRALDLDNDSVSEASLYKGITGLVLAVADLERSDRSAMPLFELEPYARNDWTELPSVRVPRVRS